MTDAETQDLLRALAHNCACVLDSGVLRSTCSAHQLLTDEATIARLAFGRHLAARLRAEELQVATEAVTAATV